MDLKEEIRNILDVYGCLDIHDDNVFGRIYNEMRNEDLVNDLFALYDVVCRKA